MTSDGGSQKSMVALAVLLPARLENDASMAQAPLAVARALEAARPAGLRRCQTAGADFTAASPRGCGPPRAGAPHGNYSAEPRTATTRRSPDGPCALSANQRGSAANGACS